MNLLKIEWDNEIGPILVVNICNKNLGFCFCHQRKDRSIWFFGLERIFCSRCLGIIIGGFIGIFFAILGYTLDAFFSGLFLLPLIIDGLYQATGKRESTNLIRLITGFFFGFGLQSIVRIIIVSFRFLS